MTEGYHDVRAGPDRAWLGHAPLFGVMILVPCSTATGRSARRTGLSDLARSSGDRLVVETVDTMVPEEVATRHDRLAQAAQAGKGGLQYLDYRGQAVRW
jgi:hypothetical protein